MKVPAQLYGSILLSGDGRETVYRRVGEGGQTTDIPDHTGMVQFEWEGPD